MRLWRNNLLVLREAFISILCRLKSMLNSSNDRLVCRRRNSCAAGIGEILRET